MKTMYKAISIITILLLTSLNCQKNPNIDKEKEVLLKVDTEFSKMSIEQGAAEAFYYYFAEDGMQIRPNGDPVVGKETIREQLTSTQKFTLKWEPKTAVVSKLGDLGYTWGTYKTIIEVQDSSELERTGKYLTVWKKQSNGSWKVIADIGTQDTKK
jgi:ketosteroid isomerase-like protein